MTTLPIPPIRGQRTVLLPDGNIDPDAITDCGESVLSSVIDALRGMNLSPGCIRQSLGLPFGTGATTTEDLHRFLGWIATHVKTTSLSGDAFAAELRRLRHHGRYCIALGQWVQSGTGHWYLFYEAAGLRYLAMDPWTATYRNVPANVVKRDSWDRQLWVSA